MPVLIHLAPRTPGPGRLRRGRGPRTRLCTPGSPRGRCAIARACALGGPTELRLSPAGTPGGGPRALHAGFSAALVQEQLHSSAAHTNARAAAPPGCASKQRRRLPPGDAAERWQGGRSGRRIATRNPFVRSRGGARQRRRAVRGARGSVPGKPAWSGAAPARPRT